MKQDRRPVETRSDDVVRPASVERARSGAGVTARDLSGRPVSTRRPLEPQRTGEGGLAHVVEVLLDRGLVINADIMVSVAGVELLGIRLRAALASFETAARYGLEFPSGTNWEPPGRRPKKRRRPARVREAVSSKQLLEEYCPWCGWRSAKALTEAARTGDASGESREGDGA